MQVLPLGRRVEIPFETLIRKRRHVFRHRWCLVFKTVLTIFQDTRFNHDIDARTGYKTHSLLCMPIKDFNGEVMGVAQVSFGYE